MTYKRKKYHHGDTHLKKRWRLRNRKKDLDEIDTDLKEDNAEKLLNQDIDLDLPGAAQHYCLHCARYFIDEHSLNEHFKTKVHKRRLKALELEPYTVEESERAAGHGNFKLPTKRKIETQNINKKSLTDADGDTILEDDIPNKYFNECFEKIDLVREELRKRKCKIDLNKIQNLWSIYQELELVKSNYDREREEISKQLSKLIKSEPDSETTNKLKIQNKLIKDNLRKLKVPLWSAEEAAILEYLKLPNALHSTTPDSVNNVFFTHLSPPRSKKDHLKIAKDLNIMNFKKNENYYLIGDAAIFELGAKFYMNSMLRKSNFVQFSNPDFVKSVVVEGCGLDHTDPDSTFILHHNDDTKLNINNRLHLTGGGSLFSFMAYYTKNILYPKVLPLKVFTMGRQYVPSPSNEDSLFHVSQSSVVELFSATRTAQEMEELFSEMIQLLKLSYSQLGYHFQMSFLSADKLNTWESSRVIVEMYSTSLDSYVEIANISLSGDFISKRLMFTYVDNKQTQFPHIISGTMLNVPKLLACVLEQDEEFELPTQFQVKNWSI
ncbi:unnamed protein product [Diatraea saccharalis]|uniref:Zinc finger protein 593 homolog n=1 Tax=Diatraea saccharalis TaxID=40085 RepID=A0A9N9R8S8_9NEOP|nr:unnamed protein product [Diatraea saccharalis]